MVFSVIAQNIEANAAAPKIKKEIISFPTLHVQFHLD